MKPFHWILTVVLAAIFGWAVVVAYQNWGSAPAVIEETESERESSIQDAFAPSAEGSAVRDASANPELKKEINAYFADLGQAFATVDTAEITQLIWGEGILLCAEGRGLITLPTGFRRKKFMEGFNRGFSGSAEGVATTMKFEEHRLQLIEEIREGEVIAYVRLWLSDFQTYSKMRWWLLRDADGRWKAYDYEDFDQNLRTSSLVGALMNAAESNAPWVKPTLKLIQGMQGLASSGELLTGIGSLQDDVDAVLNTAAPDAVKSIAYTFRYSSLAIDGKFEEGLKALEEMEKLDPGSPLALYGRGVCYLGLERADEAIAALTTYANRLGWDADVCDLMSAAYLAKDDTAAAIDFAKRGLVDTPESVDCLIDLGLALPPEQIGEFAEFAAKRKDPEAGYEATLDYCLEAGYDEEAGAIYELLKKNFPESELIGIYRPEIEGVDPDAAT